MARFTTKIRGAVAIAAAVALAPLAARADDTWTDPFPGVRHLHRVTSFPRNVHALVIDLCATGIRLRATRSSERGKTVSAFGKAIGAQAAINGDFFTYSTYKTTGLSIGKGERWEDTSDPNFEGFVAFGAGAADLSPYREVVSDPPDWMTEVVSGRPQVLVAGVVRTDFDCVSQPGYCARDPRTGVGLSQDRRTLYLAVVDGRNDSLSKGWTSTELGTFMKEMGAWDALSLDSGGSSEMWLSGTGVLNHPSDGSERVVANHLALFAGGADAPASCIPQPEPPDAGPGDPDSGAPATGDDDGDGDGDGMGGGCGVAGGTRCDPGRLGALVILAGWAVRRRRPSPRRRRG